MSIRTSRSDCIRWEIKVEDGREIAMDLQIYSMPDEQKSQIEKAVRAFYDQAMEILKNSPIF